MNPNAINDFGGIATAETTVTMFFLTGVAFGAPFSMTRINVVDWIYTRWYKKVIRILLALSIMVGWYLFLNWILGYSDEQVQTLIYQLSVGFFMYGPYVYLCCQR